MWRRRRVPFKALQAEHQTQSLELARELGNSTTEAIALGKIGNIYLSLNDYQTALDYQIQGLELVRKLGDRATEATILGDIGTTHEALGDYPQAQEYQQLSLDIRRELGLGED